MRVGNGVLECREISEKLFRVLLNSTLTEVTDNIGIRISMRDLPPPIYSGYGAIRIVIYDLRIEMIPSIRIYDFHNIRDAI